MRNEVFYPNDPADKLSLPVPEGTKSGDPVVVGSIIGIAATDRGAGGNPAGNASVWTEGVYRLTASTAVAAVGTALYKPGNSLKLTTTGTDNALFGYALETKGAGDGDIRVKLAKV